MSAPAASRSGPASSAQAQQLLAMRSAAVAAPTPLSQPPLSWGGRVWQPQHGAALTKRALQRTQRGARTLFNVKLDEVRNARRSFCNGLNGGFGGVRCVDPGGSRGLHEVEARFIVNLCERGGAQHAGHGAAAEAADAEPGRLLRCEHHHLERPLRLKPLHACVHRYIEGRRLNRVERLGASYMHGGVLGTSPEETRAVWRGKIMQLPQHMACGHACLPFEREARVKCADTRHDNQTAAERRHADRLGLLLRYSQ